MKREKEYSVYVQGDTLLNAKDTERKGMGWDKNNSYRMSNMD